MNHRPGNPPAATRPTGRAHRRALQASVPALTFALLLAQANGEERARPAIAEKSLAFILQQFPYSAEIAAAAKDESMADEPVITLDAVTISDSRHQREIRQKIEANRQKIIDQEFALQKGGTLLTKNLGNARLELGLWPGGPGLNLLKLSW